MNNCIISIFPCLFENVKKEMGAFPMPFRRLFHRDFVLFLSSDFPVCHFYRALLSITFLYTQNNSFLSA